MRARLVREDGFVVPTTMILIVTTLLMGVALLSRVDVQSDQSRRQRVADQSFNLAEATIETTAFELSRAWPTAVGLAPNGTSAVCGQQTLSGTLAAPASTTTLAGRIQARLRSAYSDLPSASTWTVALCDDTGRTTTWTPSFLTSAPAWDSNGIDSTTSKARMWVRAQTSVNGVVRTITSLVEVTATPAMPANYAVLAGGFAADATMGVNSITSAALLGPLTSSLLGTGKLYKEDPSNTAGGHLGVRCGVLTGCVFGGLFSTISQTTLSNLLLANETNQYASSTALNDDQVSQLRRQAQASGTYVSSVADGGACLPASSAGNVVFIEQVGTGDGTCLISSSGSAKALVVANGRVKLVGGASSAATTTFTGVVYALYRQRANSPAPNDDKVVWIDGWSKVTGAVYIDGTGQLRVNPPAFAQNALLIALGICPGLLCSTLSGVTNLVDTLLSGICIPLLGCLAAVSPTNLANALLNQLTGYGPAVQEDDTVVRQVKTYGSSGTIRNTVREVGASG